MNQDRADLLRRRVTQRGTAASRAGSWDPAPSVADRRSLVEAFDATVAAHPDRDAVRCAGAVWTYRELDDRVHALAAAVRGLGADPGRPVGVFLERSADMVAAAIAALRTGASYVPLDPSTPRARLALILEDADPSAVITSRALAPTVPGGVPVVCVDEALPVPAEPVPAAELGRDSRAYIIFTSGTTGRPKGVQVSHGNVLRLFSVSQELHGFGPDDVWSLFHTFAFDVSVWEMWGPLLHGGCLVVVEQETAKDPAAFWELLRRERVTMLSQTPSAFNQLIAEDAGRSERLPLRRVVLAGEALHFSDLRPWVAKYGDAAPQLINQYGPTETTVYASCRRVRAADLSEGRSLIGGPLPDLRFLVVDADLREVPAGQRGELVVSGPGVTLGYLRSPELNRERFVELPGGRGRGYRTGDLVERTESGDFAFHGRTDDQVKIRGHRVELGEVEGALRALDSLAEAAVAARELPGLGTSLVAYVVPARPELTAVALRRELAAALPPYMVPGVFVAVDALPLTQNGKLDRKALPDPEHAPRLGEGTVQQASAPGAPAEESGGDDATAVRIAALVAELLKLERVDPAAGFFELGGHSLVAIRLLSRVHGEFGVDVPLRDFLREPTARALARAVRAESGPGQDAAPGGLVLARAPERDRAPATDPQTRLYYLSQLEPDSGAYNLHQTVLLHGDLDVAALGRAFAALVDRHAPLRTVLRLEDEGLVQVVLPGGRFSLEPEHLGTPTDGDWAAAVRRLSEAELARPFDLERDAMLRVRLIRVDARRHALLITAHHAASDGWSHAVLSRELVELYGYFKQRPDAEETPLAPLGLEYVDYAHSMHAWLSGPAAEQDIAYWERRLEGLPAVHELPLDQPRPHTMTYAGEMHEVVLSKAETDAVRTLGLGENATPFVVLQTAFAVLLARRSGARDIVLGTPVANRRAAELEGLIGMFVNSLVLRTEVDPDLGFRELLGRVREQTLRDLEHQHVPFDVLVRRLNPERSAAHSPLFQIMFVYQNNEAARLDLDGLVATPVRSPEQDAQTDLVLDVLEEADGLRLRWRFNTDLFRRGTVEALAREFRSLLRSAVERPDTAVAQLDTAVSGPGGTAATAPVRGLFPLRQNPSSATPVFALPGVLGLGASFAQLSAHFEERSFHALNTREILQARRGEADLLTLADDCARVISRAAGDRVHLVGHSYGGALSGYVAESLARRGVEVGAVVLLDALAPDAVQRKLVTGREDQLKEFLSTLAGLFPVLGERYAAEGVEAVWARSEAELLTEVGRLIGPSALELLGDGLAETFEAFRAMSSLTWPAPPVAERPVLLVEALEAAASRGAGGVSPRASWERLVPPAALSCASVTAGHETMLRQPRAAELAALVRRFLAAQDRGPAPVPAGELAGR
ncbi:amino acid adenylation domain-containing protein [Streptomyces sp. NPDC002851]